MARTQQCPVCGAEIPPDAPSGMCLACLLSAGRQGGSTDPKSPDSDATIRISSVSEECVGDTIGRYKLLEKIGEGGFGVVWAAEQREPVRRRVALKIIKLGMDTKQVVARFEAERQALAMMDHPNIAKVLDAGVTESGRPYFVMELVHGIKITDYCDRSKLPTRERLLLFTKVCRAVQHAHQKGIIHRDLKPGNILVTLYDGVPEPKVIDFGIAKATQGSLTDKTVYTGFQQIIGSPPYMSPEQAEMSALDIDTRTDIYSLGVLLYEILSGRTPFDQKELLEAGLEAMLRIIREREPLRPSTRLNTLQAGEQTTVARCRGTEAPKLIHLLRGDLDWIVMKSLEKDRTRRYETANGMALDIERHLANEPVTACPPSAAYRLQKMVRRHTLAVAASVAVMASLVAGLGISLHLFFQEQEDDKRAVGAERDAQVALQKANENASKAESEKNQADAAREREKLALGRTRIRTAEDYFTVDTPMAIAYLSRVIRDDQSNRVAAERLLSALTYRHFALPRTMELRHGGAVNMVRFSPDGQLVVTASDDGTARLWNSATGTEVGQPLRHNAAVKWAEFSPGGELVATGSEDRTAKIWKSNFADSSPILLPHSNAVCVARFSPNGKLLATATEDGTATVWEVATGNRVGGAALPRDPMDMPPTLEFTPDGNYFVTTGCQGAEICDVRTGHSQFRPLPHGHCVAGADFNPSGDWLVTACWDHFAYLWDVRSGQLLRKFGGGDDGHTAVLFGARFDPDGRLILTFSKDGRAKVWDATTGRLIKSKAISMGSPVLSARFSPDGSWVAAASVSGSAQVFETTTGLPVTEPIFHNDEIRWIEFNPTGDKVATASADHTARIWDLPRGLGPGLVLNHAKSGETNQVKSANFSPDGACVITASQDNTARIWDTRKGNRQRILPELPTTPEKAGSGAEERLALRATYSPDGHWVATTIHSTTNGIAQVWNATTGQPFGAPVVYADGAIFDTEFSTDSRYFLTSGYANKGSSGRLFMIGNTLVPKREWVNEAFVDSVCFSPDGRRIIASSDGKLSAIFDVPSGQRIYSLEHRDKTAVVRFSPNGELVATASWDCTAQLWNALTGKRKRGALRHLGFVLAMEFSPNGEQLITGSFDCTARIWDVGTGLAKTDLLRHQGAVLSVQFSRDGKRVVTASRDGTARVWDVQTGLAVSEPLRHSDIVNMGRFSPDGTLVVTASDDGTARLWPVPPVDEPAPLWFMELAEALGGQRLNEQDQPESVSIDSIVALRNLLKDNQADDVFSRWAKWFFADPTYRAAFPAR